MTREDAISVAQSLQFVCTCLCGFQRRCTSIEDAQATASRHAVPLRRQPGCRARMMRRWGQIAGWVASVGLAVALVSAAVWLAYAQ